MRSVIRLSTRVFTSLLVSVLSAGGCRESGAPATAPATVQMAIGNETFKLEVADTEVKAKRGLMYRESMPPDHGMLFIFDDNAPRAFWMENTLIPLDIIYLQGSGRVVSVKSMKPRDRTPVPSDAPAMYAIELNQGAADRAGVRAGDVLIIPPDVLQKSGQKPVQVP